MQHAQTTYAKSRGHRRATHLFFIVRKTRSLISSIVAVISRPPCPAASIHGPVLASRTARRDPNISPSPPTAPVKTAHGSRHSSDAVASLQPNADSGGTAAVLQAGNAASPRRGSDLPQTHKAAIPAPFRRPLRSRPWVCASADVPASPPPSFVARSAPEPARSSPFALPLPLKNLDPASTSALASGFCSRPHEPAGRLLGGQGVRGRRTVTPHGQGVCGQRHESA